MRRVVLSMLLLTSTGAWGAGKEPLAVVKECLALQEAKQYDKALAVCTAAAKTGDLEAKYRLGLLYEKGNGVERNLDAAFKLYLSAAQKGHAASQRRVAAAYYWGVGGVAKDEAKAFEWFKRAADGGDTRAQKQMAQGYRHGVPGVLPKDEKLAREWQERADRGAQKN